MMTGPPDRGCGNILTSVPQMPATSIFRSALSSSISGIGKSRSSSLPGPTFTEASTFSTDGTPSNRSGQITGRGKQDEIAAGDDADRCVSADARRALQDDHRGGGHQGQNTRVRGIQNDDGT